jgi:hypothetical protein
VAFVSAGAELRDMAGRASEGGHVGLARVLELWAQTIEARPALVAAEARTALAVLRAAKRSAKVQDSITAYERVSDLCADLSGEPQ